MVLVIGNIDEYIIPDNFSLGNPYPNPFNPSTSIDLSLHKDSHVNAMIYNINGQVIETIVDKQVLAGKHTIEWNANEHASGIYFIKVQADNQLATQKLILIK